MKDEKLEFARQLRKNMTEEERKLWHVCLKKLPYKIRRQVIFGNYIADFYCASKKVVIEVDGEQHYTEEGEKHDKIRDEYFNNLSIKVIRYTNLQVNQKFKSVCDDIYAILSGEK